MVTVYVWDMGARDLAGHASLKVGTTYISWWPEHNRDDVGLRRKGLRPAYGGPSYANTMQEDKDHKGRLPDYVSAGIHCLDEPAILTWWEGIRPKNTQCKLTYSEEENIHYDLARLSCATVAMRGLLIGGGAKVATPPVLKVSMVLRGAAAWAGGVVGAVFAELSVADAVSPMEVKRFAEDLAKSKDNKRPA